MHFFNRAAGLLSLCAFSNACGGTFCDEYPEACGTSFDVEVSLLDASGALLPNIPVLVSDLDGKIVELRFTDAGAPLLVTLPGDSYVSVFNADTNAFTAFATRDTSSLRFQLPVAASPGNPAVDVQVSASCGVAACGDDVELSVSCGVPTKLMVAGSSADGVLSDYSGCASSTSYDAYVVAYDDRGVASRAGHGTGDVSSQTLLVPTATALRQSERFDFEMRLDTTLELDGVTRWVRSLHADGPEYGFSRLSKDPEAAVRFSLVQKFVADGQALFLLSLPDERSLRRQQLFEPVPAQIIFAPDLGIPLRPPALQLDDPARPRAYYVLDDGRLADALQLRVEQGALVWAVSIPADAKGNFSFPELPDELSSFLLQDADDYDVLHLDLDVADGYAGFASEPIRDYGGDAGRADLTIARSSR